MGVTDGNDAAELKKRAERLRECARQARTIARRLGPYLDAAVAKATPRTGGTVGGTGDAIWLGPFADQCTSTLQQRQNKLSSLATALMADATRWENEAATLDDQAKAKAKAKAPTGGH